MSNVKLSAAADQLLNTWQAMDAVRWSVARMGDFSSPCVGKTRVVIDGPAMRAETVQWARGWTYSTR